MVLLADTVINLAWYKICYFGQVSLGTGGCNVNISFHGLAMDAVTSRISYWELLISTWFQHTHFVIL